MTRGCLSHPEAVIRRLELQASHGAGGRPDGRGDKGLSVEAMESRKARRWEGTGLPFMSA